MISQTSLIHAERVQIRLPTQSRTRYRIAPPNEIEYHHRAYPIAYRMASWETAEKTTKGWSPRPHSDGYHCRRTSHRDREDYREPYRTKPLTKMLTKWRTEGSRNYHRTAYKTEYQTTITEAYQMTTESQRIFAEAAYWDCHREVNQERTEAIIRMTSTEKRSTETLPNAESRDAEICICNVQSGFPRAEARSYHGEYDHLLRSLHVRYGSMIYRPRPMQLACSTTFEWSPASHKWEPTAMTMPGAEAHINVQRQDESHVMIDYFTDITPAKFRRWSMTETQLYEVKAEPNSVSNHRDDDYNPELRLHSTEPWWQSTTNMMQKSSTEQRIFNEGDSRVYTIKSYRQVDAHRVAVYRDTPRCLRRIRPRF